MRAVARLPYPGLSCSRFAIGDGIRPEACHVPSHEASDTLEVLTDQVLFDACGVRIAFTGRNGGVSSNAYRSLNLGAHVEDDLDCVLQNRERLMSALGCPHASLVVPNQVHGTRIVRIEDASLAHAAQLDASEGADGLAVLCSDVAALLCFADCMPVIIVAPSGDFAVVHAGWRGVYGHIAIPALQLLCEHASCDPAECNAYLGPFIHPECFEVGADLAQKFQAEFGSECIASPCHVDLAQAVRLDLESAGMDSRRLVSSGICTVCNSDRYFSYRASGGVCGRHGAFAVRISE